jgi:hypothetical protein
MKKLIIYFGIHGVSYLHLTAASTPASISEVTRYSEKTTTLKHSKPQGVGMIEHDQGVHSNLESSFLCTTIFRSKTRRSVETNSDMNNPLI